MALLSFPEHFQWGVASASYQVEGAVCEDGRSESIWDRYCSIPGNVANGEDGSVACDHYHRFREDVSLMKSMGVRAYRFSIAWPRVCPYGDDTVNPKGLTFYSKLVDELLAAGITPYATLYHWDLPQCMQDIGGWTNPDMPRRFEQYCRAVMDGLGDRVHHWITLNEPYCAVFLGHYEGRQAPGLHDFSAALLAAHHMYLGHARVVRYFRESGKTGEIGIALNLMGRHPLTDDALDQKAALRADGYLNRWFLDPLFKGDYPGDMVDWYRSKGCHVPAFNAEEKRLISQPLDFLGINYYNDFWVEHTPDAWPLDFRVLTPPGLPTNDRNWPITEEGFHTMLMRLHQQYQPAKILITENGTSTNDSPDLRGCIMDMDRVDYLNRHLLQLHRAIQDGAPVFGYMHWSLMDNFEWSFGYKSRFGLVHVDFKTQKRTIKQSGLTYAWKTENPMK